MPNSFGSNLFERASKGARNAARAAFRGSSIGQLVTEAERIVARGRAGRRAMEKLGRQLEGLHNRGVFSELAKTTGLTEIAKYAGGSGGSWRNFLLNQLFSSLGPIGGVLQALLRPSGRSLTSSLARELTGASQLLKAFGFEVIAPPGHRADMTAKAQAAQNFLQALGFTVLPPGSQSGISGAGPSITQTLPGSGQITGQSGQPGLTGSQGPFTPAQRSPLSQSFTGQPGKGISGGNPNLGHGGDPVYTGEMIHVQSSNVHSIGFDIDWDRKNEGTLKVRFLAHDENFTGKTSEEGSLYFYKKVPVALFRAFLRASSKGIFVWDHLRVRGTVSGHQFEYSLAGISQGYVPRKATLMANQQEWFIQREFGGMGANGEMILSQLPSAPVMPWHNRGLGGDGMGGPNRGTPNRGGPNRGGPNRGTPNRGRG